MPARRRLQQAALELYREQGYERTTTAQIAARAGVNERTYFRHFADKREVLFGGEVEFNDAAAAAVAAAPDVADPLGTVVAALQTAADGLEARRRFSVERAPIIEVTAALRERELMKGAVLVGVLGRALEGRGLAPLRAALAAEIGWAVFYRAAGSWLGGSARSLRICIGDTYGEVRLLLDASSGTPERLPEPPTGSVDAGPDLRRDVEGGGAGAA